MTPRTASQRVLDHCIGENLDRIITLDMRGDGICRAIYDAAREVTGTPLTTNAAAAVVEAVTPGSRVLFLTGFLIPPTNVPETDGIIGSAIVANVMARALGAVPVIVCEPEAHQAMRAALVATGLGVVDSVEAAHAGTTAVLIAFSRSEVDPGVRARLILDEVDPVLGIAIERPGANAKGKYHFAGGLNVSSSIAKVDVLFTTMREQCVPTVAIGDFGNELGMGAILETVRSQTPAGADCGCGCGGGTANEVAADATIACTVSDWGAYALSAAICHLTDRLDAYPTVDTYRRTARDASVAGAIDGTSRLGIPDIDGVPADFNAAIFAQLIEATRLPRREVYDNDGRRYRATHYFPEQS